MSRKTIRLKGALNHIRDTEGLHKISPTPDGIHIRRGTTNQRKILAGKHVANRKALGAGNYRKTLVKQHGLMIRRLKSAVKAGKTSFR